MKKILLLTAIMFVAVSFSACSDDDKDEKNQSLVSGNTRILRAMITV